MNFVDFDYDTQREMLSVARSVLPDGGPLDDDYPDYECKVAQALEDAFPQVVELDPYGPYYSDDLISDIMMRATSSL